jgi:polar amino acid transport system substrate-binding protein
MAIGTLNTGKASCGISLGTVRRGDGRETEDKEALPAADNKDLVAGGFMKYALSKTLGMGLVALIGIAPQAHAQQALETIQSTKTVRIGVPVDAPPFGFIAADQQPAGLDVDVAQLIGAKLGAKVQLVPVASAQRIPALLDKKVDLVVSTLGKNAEREKQIDFSESYSSFYLAVFGPKGTSIATAGDLAGKTVAVTKGSIEDQELTKAAGSADVKRFDDNASTLTAYSAGKVQFVAAGVSVVAAAISKDSKLDAESKFVLKESLNYVGIPKGEEKLREKVNAAIEEARASGELRRLSQKWFSRAGMSASRR